jgi:hypothetical protein
MSGNQPSPAIDAMRQTGTQMATSPGGAATQAPGAVGGTSATTQVPKIDVQQVDTTRMDDAYGQQDATYDRMLAEQQKMWGDTQHMMQQNFSGTMRRNASNAARMGLSVGGASYLSGQRSAMNQAGNYARQAGLDSWNQQRDIMKGRADAYGSQATNYGNVGIANTGDRNAANRLEAQRGWDIDDRAADAAAELNKNKNIAAVDQVRTGFDWLFNDNNFKDKKGQYETLVSDFENALNTGATDEEIAAAYNKLISFVTPYQRAKEARTQTGPNRLLNTYNAARGR